MSLWTAEEAAEATGGWASGWSASGVSIDTRELAPGDLFVALRDRRDGHEFVAKALAGGAAAAMVSRAPEGVAPDAPLLMVDDVLAGLTALGRAGRARVDPRSPVVAVTGSAGKTSAKEMLRAALGDGVHAAVRSFNNHWGVPLTLARMPRGAEVAVVEIGMSAPGEIAPLSRLARPHVALITTVGPAHLDAFGSVEGIADEKASIAEGLEADGVLVIPADLPTTERLRRAAGGARVAAFGEAPGAEVRLMGAEPSGTGTAARASVGGATIPLTLAVPGRHHLSNALGVLAVVQALGRDVAAAADRLAGWRPPDGRGTREVLALPCGEVTLIDEAFNANPASMAAALSALPALSGRVVAVLGDMLELGPTAPSLHAALADDPGLRSADVVHAVGPLMRHLHEALPGDRRGLWTEDATALAETLPATLRRGDTVIVKGSKGIRVALVVDALRALGHPPRGRQDDREGGPRCSTG